MSDERAAVVWYITYEYSFDPFTSLERMTPILLVPEYPLVLRALWFDPFTSSPASRTGCRIGIARFRSSLYTAKIPITSTSIIIIIRMYQNVPAAASPYFSGKIIFIRNNPLGTYLGNT